MTDWRPQSTYCNGCGSWHTDIVHRGCRKGEHGSRVWIDLDSFHSGCSKCNEVWPLDNSRFYCSCGHVQETEYVDSELTLEAHDEILATDGDLVYILRESGVVSIASRTYLDHGYS